MQVLTDLLKENELDLYRSIYEDFMTGKLVMSKINSNLGVRRGQEGLLSLK
jgi:hypothetical protein